MEDIKAENFEYISKDGTNIDIAEEAAASRTRFARKRTKTGCLTCRKRRIKCDEVKPICRNCVKSRRQCDGYSQQPAFRPADFRYMGPHGAASITFHASAFPTAAAPDPGVYSSHGRPELRPRMIAPQGYALPPNVPLQFQQLSSQQGVMCDSVPIAQPRVNPYVQTQQQNMNVWPQTQMQAQAQAQTHGFSQANYVPVQSNPYVQLPTGAVVPHLFVDDSRNPHAFDNQSRLPPGFPTRVETLEEHSIPQYTWGSGSIPLPTLPATSDWSNERAHIDPTQPRFPRITISQTHTVTTIQHDWPATGHAPRPELTQPIHRQEAPPVSYPTYKFQASQLYKQDTEQEELPPSQPFIAPCPVNSEGIASHESLSPARLLEDAAVEQHDDGYYDIDEEDDKDLAISVKVLEQKSQSVLGTVVAMSGLNISSSSMRGFDTFLYDGILDTYRPERVANPLGNAATARVFAHFIAATGPLLTIFVRQTRVASSLLHDGPRPLNQQGLWTYIMPMAALHHQGLLQAILAISSLHIAKLQRASETPSFKHYGYALKRIHRSVRNPEKRHSAAMLAATLLLGYYEVMAANHTNWNTHLAGARQLVVEIDFASMTREFRRMKAEKAFRDQQNPYCMTDMPPLPYNSQPQDILLDQIPDIDEDIVGIFAGRSLQYDQYGQVIIEECSESPPKSRLPLDLVDYETLKDLFWWYCRQDVYQSIISGNPLLMSFDHWTDCPPRAPLNKADAVYGSFDHLMILLARIADFTTRDRRRKMKVMHANGGVWRPAPGMQMGPPPGTQPPPPRQETFPTSVRGVTGTVSGAPAMHSPQGGTPVQMPFFGMAPSSKKGNTMPSSYHPTFPGYAEQTPTPGASPPNSDQDLTVATELALQEWQQIRDVVQLFATKLGRSFQPLDPNHQPPMESPFGPVIFYRSWDISCLWSIYYMCLTILIRAHPHMPPAAHMAAGVAASQTRDIVMTIGRIAAGVPMPAPEQPLNPNLAASLCDLCVPLFFAGISYQTKDQRAWLIERLFEVDRRAGWSTAGIIAEGCQTAWIKAAAAGRGPPHERVQKTSFNDIRVRKYRTGYEVVQGTVDESEQDDDMSRKFVHEKAAARLHWGIGIIGGEDDYRLEAG